MAKFIVAGHEGKVAYGPASEKTCAAWATRAMRERGGAYFVEPVDTRTMSEMLAAKKALASFTRSGSNFTKRPGGWQVWIRSASMPHKAFELWATAETRDRAAEIRDDLQGYGGYLVELRHSSDKHRTPAELDAEINAHARGVSERAAKERTARKRRSGVKPGGKRDV